jgi:hypothetical protein
MGGGEVGYSPDFGQLYGQADMSRNLLEADRYPAVVEEASWDLTKDGTKGAWTIVFRTTGPGKKKGLGATGSKLTMTLSVSPTKNDGSPNPQGLGIMYRQLGALGIPIPPAMPFWQLGWSPQQVAQAMVGKACIIQVIQNEWDGGVNNKVRDIQPPEPGQPTQLPQPGQAQPGQPPSGGPAPQGAAPGPQQGYGPPPGQQGGYAPQGGQQAPQPWQQPQQPQGGQQGYAQGVPQAQPGQGGYGEFTQQGQSYQPGITPNPPANGYPQQGQPQQGQGQGQQGGAPAPPPWAQPPQ